MGRDRLSLCPPETRSALFVAILDGQRSRRDEKEDEKESESEGRRRGEGGQGKNRERGRYLGEGYSSSQTFETQIPPERYHNEREPSK